MKSVTNPEFSQAVIEMQVDYDASAAEVWTALVDQMADWWPPSFNIGGAEAKVHFDPVVGGDFYEEWPGGGGIKWWTNVTIKPGEQLQTVGELFPEFGGPARVYSTFRLEESSGKTTLIFKQTLVGVIGDATPDALDEGWVYLLERAFPAYLRGEEQPAWGE